jgi:hypothetical protein
MALGYGHAAAMEILPARTNSYKSCPACQTR